MARILLLSGSNLGNRAQNLANAKEKLAGINVNVLKFSGIYETEPWGDIPQDSFYNQAILAETSLKPAELMLKILALEYSLGRIRGSEQYAPRTIDLDVIFYDDRVLNLPEIVVPHPRMHLRRFVLQPASEIVPEWEHPVFHKTIACLLEECPDTGAVNRINL
jgi:2-amino-4-hydroxy-6-hydroxymethyldihydropteridine diphosphokinase